MDIMAAGLHENDGGASGSQIRSLSYQFRVSDLHELITTEEKRETLLPVLDFFIRSQAALHHAEYVGNLESLEHNILMKGNTFRGIVVYSNTNLPIAYAVYYPMVNEEGARGNYVEDAYLTESFRGHKIMTFVYHQLAKRCDKEGAKFLQWSTDKRNLPFQGFSQKIGALQPQIKTVSANDFLSPDYSPAPSQLRKAWQSCQYVTVPLVGQHVNMLQPLNVTPDLLRKTGDLDFKGFITFRSDNMKNPVAVTPGWPHMSTFKLKHGLVLEHPSFNEILPLSEEDRIDIMLSCAKAAREYSQNSGTSYSYLKWHLKDDGSLPINLLIRDLGFSVDTMLDTEESEMGLFVLKNGKLRALSRQREVDKVDIPANGAIGARPPEPRINGSHRPT